MTVIGGHTDYNGGLVLSAPLSLGTAVAIGRNGTGVTRLFSDREPQVVQTRAGELPTDPGAFWTRYVLGVLLDLGLGGVGLDVSICSDLPMRRGLASSAALTVAIALAGAQLAGLQASKRELAPLCQQAERTHVGVHCGLLDPYTALHAVAGHGLLVDCATQTHEVVRLPPDLALIVCDSGTDRQLARSLYNVRRAECQQVADALRRPSLRSVELADLEPLRRTMPVQARRAEHVIREIQRVEPFCHALRAADYASTKQIMAEAHRSCRELFECSHPELDVLVERATAHPGCVGARLTGAGWGGATVNLVLLSAVNDFLEIVGPGRCRVVV